MVDNQPFPTLFWRCSKDLCKAIGQIEGDGWVKQIETQLQQNSELRDQFYQDQHRYVARRWQLMDSGDRQDIEGAGLTPLFDRYGIGGITQWDKIRCLHMQYAHHLAEGNVIGALIEEQFGLKALTIRR